MNGWKIAHISDFCTTGTGGTPSRSNMERYYEGGKIPWVKSGELRETVIYETEEHVTEEALQETHLKLVPSGALLLAMYGATVGRLGILGAPATTNQAICHIIPDPRIADVRYLFHLLRSQVPNIVSRGVGGAQPNISQGIVKDLKIPIPPIEEQKRIADILDRAEALRTKRIAALDQLDELKKAIFIDMFGDPFTQNDNIIRLSDVADIFMGQSPSGSSYNSEGIGTPLLNGPTEFGELCPTEKQWTTKPTRICEVGDILFCVRGATAGRLNRADKVYCLGRGLAAIRPRRGTAVNANFLFTMLGHYYEYFQTKGVGSTFINISRKELEDLPVPNVHNDKTNIFSQRVEIIEKLKAAHKASFEELNELFTSLQYRAFRRNCN